jgi:hypothetical protein
MKNPEGKHRKKARALLVKHGYRVGGHVTTAEAKNDAIRAVHAHERQDHKGKPLTKIKLKRGGAASGERPAARADKPRRAAGGRNKKAGTKVVIVNAGGAQPHPQPVPVPVPTPAGAPPMAARPPMAPPPGGMPGGMPMRPPGQKRGGRTEERKKGGAVGLSAGSKNAASKEAKARAYGHGHG